jgi:hypothetical protein
MVAIYARKLERCWAQAAADGQKFFECQGYAQRPMRMMGGFRAGDLIVFGPTRCTQGNLISGIAQVSSSPSAPTTIAAASQELEPLLHEPLRQALASYFAPKMFVETVHFDVIWDLRALSLTYADFMALLGQTLPTQWQNFPLLARGDAVDLYISLVELFENPRVEKREHLTWV